MVYPALYEHEAAETEGDDRLTGSANNSENKVRKMLHTTPLSFRPEGMHFFDADTESVIA